MGYKSFNSTGRDDSTTEIITPKGDTQRKLTFTVIALLMIVGLCIYGFLQTGLNPLNPTPDEGSHGFGQRPNVDIAKPTE